MTRDTVLIRTEEDVKWKELKRRKEEKEEGTERLCGAYAEPRATWEEPPCRLAGGAPVLYPLFRLPLR